MKQFASFALDTVNECLWRDGTQIALQPKPFAVLRYLVEHPGRLITHNELLDKLWPETFVQPQVLRTYMLELRKILGDDAGQPRFIQTLPKRGYCFVATVTENAAATHRAEASATEHANIVGRDSELARLRGELEAVAENRRRVVFLRGEAGIGKTALIDAFTRQAGSSVVTARGQCVPGAGDNEDFYPVVEALGQLCATPEGEAACRVLARLAPGWLRTLGLPAECAADAATPGAERERTPGGLCAALEEIAAAKPLLLVLEDLQWSDCATLDLISALARRRAPAKLMVLATSRPKRVAASHPLRELRQELLMQGLCSEMTLAPLPKAVILKLLGAELVPGEVPDGLGAFIAQRAEGNPLFAIVILRHLLAQGSLVRREATGAARWELSADFEDDAGVPDALAQMVELEIERLSPEEQRLLEAGSLMNIAFPAWAVAAALEADAVEVEEACEALARKAHFVERIGQDEMPDGSRLAFFAFTHGIYREVLFQRQTASRRARRHVRIAERLGELFAGREAHVAREMAMHYEAAGSWRLGAQALRSGARYAMERQAHSEAAELLERALRIAEHRAEAAAEARAIGEELESARAAMLDALASQEIAARKV